MNTIVGNLMGQANFRPIMASMKKTALVCFGMTMIIALPIRIAGCHPLSIIGFNRHDFDQ